MDDRIWAIARVCYEANRAYCATLGDASHPLWEDTRDCHRASYVSGVRFRLENPDAATSATHDKWMDARLGAGWSYGEIKDAATKTHPCLVPFDRLPREQQIKDVLFGAIVDALK